VGEKLGGITNHDAKRNIQNCGLVTDIKRESFEWLVRVMRIYETRLAIESFERTPAHSESAEDQTVLAVRYRMGYRVVGNMDI
jgi:hypothetical protein